MKEKIGFLFKRNEKLGAAPILFVFLGLLIVFALLYFFVFSKGEDDLVVDPPAEETEAAEEGFFSKIFGIFSPEEEVVAEETLTVPTAPQIPEDALTLDEELLKEAEEEIEEDLAAEVEIADFELNEVEVGSVGRRDPMRSLVGDNVGSFDKTRIDNDAADIKNEAKNYFGGVAVDDILLNEIKTVQPSGKLQGEFIINGSLVPHLEVGDYLLELYYIKEFNSSGNYVIIQYKEDTYKLSAKNLSNGKSYSSEGSGDIRK